MVVLGIDAAWTGRNPSGVAVVGRYASRWRLMGLASSYAKFADLSVDRRVDTGVATGSEPTISQVVNSAQRLSGGKVSLIAVDMPLSRTTIVGRRISDDLVSRMYGGRGAGTHSPSAGRPGEIGRTLTGQCEKAGYALATSSLGQRSLIEVYPHPALIELTQSPRRLPYKAANVRKYWKDITPAERRGLLLDQWSTIVRKLDQRIEGVSQALPMVPDSAIGAGLKAYEDALDAVICAWVGICALEGAAAPLGDENSAIWIPLPLG